MIGDAAVSAAPDVGRAGDCFPQLHVRSARSPRDCWPQFKDRTDVLVDDIWLPRLEFSGVDMRV